MVKILKWILSWISWWACVITGGSLSLREGGRRFEKRGRPERGGEGKVKHFSLMWRNLEYVGRQREKRGRERESQRQRWRLCRRTIDSTRSQIAEDHFYSPL